MKNKLFLVGILAMVLALEMAVVGCKDDSESGSSNPLEGTWSYLDQGQIQNSITFSGSNYDWKEITYGGLTTFERGTYSLSGNTITFHPTKTLNDNGNLIDASGADAYPYVYVYSIVGNANQGLRETRSAKAV
jgi:hypothetical protein